MPRVLPDPPRRDFAPLARLLSLASPHRRLLGCAGLLMLLTSIASLSLPLLARQAVDRVLRTRSIDAFDRLMTAMVAVIVLGAICAYLQYVLVALAGNRMVQEMRARLFAHLQRMPAAYFDTARSGNLTSHLFNDVNLLQQTLTEDLVWMAGNLVTLTGGLALAVGIDWRLTGIGIGAMALVTGVFFVLGKQLKRLSRGALDAVSETLGMMAEALSNNRLVKSFGREEHEDARAGARLQQVFQVSMRGKFVEGLFGAVAIACFALAMLGAVWYGGRHVLGGGLSPGSLLAFLMLAFVLSGPMAGMSSQYARLQRTIGAADRLFDLLDTAPEPPDAADALPFPDGPGHIRFRNVQFGYTSQTPVLHGLSLDVPAACVTALVGASGAGKTTLALLLLRLYSSQSGGIEIDGVPVERIRRRELRDRIGIVPQEPMLFSGTIRENIRYGRLDATDAEVEAAGRAANVEEFVAPLPLGYETILGERGITLSGGQRQRIAIARVVLKAPRILVLDEATSALDTRSEVLVREALERLQRGRTTLVIAHRLTTIQDADQIVVLSNGRVVETGTHADLLDLGRHYSRLYGPADLNGADFACDTQSLENSGGSVRP